MAARNFKRTDRINAEIRRELGMLVHAIVRDHGLPSVSVNDVDVTRDLDNATIWVTTLMPDDAEDATQELNHMAKQLRHELAQRMRLRKVPELRFKYDPSVDEGERIDALLRDEKAKGRL